MDWEREIVRRELTGKTRAPQNRLAHKTQAPQNRLAHKKPVCFVPLSRPHAALGFAVTVIVVVIASVDSSEALPLGARGRCPSLLLSQLTYI